MEGSIRAFPHSLVVRGEVLRFPVSLRLRGEDNAFSVDLYDHAFHVHPDRHLGYWTFGIPRSGEVELEVELDFYHRFPQRVAGVKLEGRELEPSDSWHNPDFVIPPFLDMFLSVRDGEGNEEKVFVGCYVHDGELLRRYYSQEQHLKSYEEGTNVFLQEFHAERIRVLRRLFERHFIGKGKVLDVGSGLSMFRCMGREWPFEVTCCDLDEPALRTIREQSPHYHCVSCDVADLPFEDGEFDALFAGEILEHVVDPAAALREWKRVVRPGGTLIVTTPNSGRLMNRINRVREVVNPEHINELSYEELRELFRREGLRIRECRGIYVEFLFNYFRRGKKFDLMNLRFNRPRFRPVFRMAMRAGNLVKPVAFDLVFVLEKSSS